MTGIGRIGGVIGVLCLSMSNAAWAQTYNLTGVWHTVDGATFYVRQVGNEIWWFGQQAPINPRWTNVANGSVQGEIITVRWADVPAGSTSGSGTLVLRAVSSNRLVVMQNPNNFVAGDWSR